jgi:hypothetical protein
LTILDRTETRSGIQAAFLTCDGFGYDFIVSAKTAKTVVVG